MVKFCCPFLLLLLLSGCWEGLKELNLYNKTGQTITVQTRSASQSVTNDYRIPADSTLSILHGFSGMVPFGRLTESDLPIDYLKITTAKDTILAPNREAIIIRQ